jgi:hypothetical protein
MGQLYDFPILLQTSPHHFTPPTNHHLPTFFRVELRPPCRHGSKKLADKTGTSWLGDDESIASDITTLDDGSAFSDFLRQLLVLDPEQRPAVPLAALRAHAWFSPSTPLGPGDDAWRQAMRHEQSNSQVSLAGDTDDGAAADAAAAAVAPAAPKQRGWVRGSWRQCMCHIL